MFIIQLRKILETSNIYPVLYYSIKENHNNIFG